MTERKVGMFEQALGSLGRSFDEFVPVFQKIMAQVAADMQSESYERYQMRKWLSQVPHGAIIDDVAYLVVYNEKQPELSYLIVEVIK